MDVVLRLVLSHHLLLAYQCVLYSVNLSIPGVPHTLSRMPTLGQISLVKVEMLHLVSGFSHYQPTIAYLASTK